MSQNVMRASLGTLAIVLAFALWQVLALIGVFGSALPSASESLSELVRLLSEAETWAAIADTLVMAAIGLFLGAMVGVLLGVLIGVSPVLEHASRAVLEFLKPIPPIVVLPIAVLVFGPNWEMGVFLVALGCGVQILVQTTSGVLDTDPIAIETARSYRLSGAERLYRVVLPSALPAIVSAFRIALPGALIVAVVAGLFGGAPGLGKSLYLATRVTDTPRVFALVILLGALGALIQLASTRLERALLFWHASVREGSPS